MSAPHLSVMLREILEALAPQDGERFIDGTFGAGGYSRALLAAANCRVLGIDRDPTAIARGEKMATDFEDRLTMARGNFGDLDQLAEASGFAPVDGIALDLGVSSMQFDEGERGFSFSHDGPLDMRMGGEAQGGRTAADIVNEDEVPELVRILKTYGEERRARTVALAIEAARKEAPITRTKQLAGIVERAIGSRGKPDRIHPATRTFQALRIAVNDELGELERGLLAAEQVLAENGRLAVVSFHSLEDRIVKQFLTERSGSLPHGSRHLPEAPQGPAPTFELLFRGAETPADDEVAQNPRARSARLRGARRTAAPAWANLRKGGEGRS